MPFPLRSDVRAAFLILPLCLAGFAAQAAEAFRDCPRCPEMVALPNGPAGPFAIGRFEVTFDDWKACVEAKACRGGQDDHGWGRGRRPVINITWADAVAYARWLSRLTGFVYALPTEAEWEYAARAGSETAFWWGDAAGRGHANCRECDDRWGGRSTAPVGSFPPNPFGLYDMNGNVWEWSADCWGAPSAGESCRERVIKGGSWYYFAPMAAASARSKLDAAQWSYNVGFRLVRRE